jgi:hypothetical protein
MIAATDSASVSVKALEDLMREGARDEDQTMAVRLSRMFKKKRNT